MRVTSYKAFVISSLAVLLLLGSTGCESTPKAAKQAPRQYSFWPAAPDEPHIQFLRAFNSSADVAPAQSEFKEAMYGRSQVLPITKPYGVAMWKGKIYVCDVRSKGVTVLDLRQQLVKAIGVGGAIEIVKANDIAIAPDGFKYVVDEYSHAIVVMDPQDNLVTRFTAKDFNPVGVAVYENELFIADYEARNVKVLNRQTGELVRTIGEGGTEDGQFVRPLAVEVDPKGILFVADVINSRVQRFTRDGKFLSSFGRPGNRPGDLIRPKHFSFDSNGFLYIADAAFNNVQVFDDEQKVVGYFGSAGRHPGAMSLPLGVFVDESPEDLAIFQPYVHPAFQAERLVLVTNQLGNQRVSVYAEGHLKPGKTIADIAGSRSKVSTGTTVPTTNPSTQPIFMPATPVPQQAQP